MNAFQWIMVAAMLLGPILAVQIQKFLEARRELRRTRMNLFHTLMQTRGSRRDPAHVQALNSIDLTVRNWAGGNERVSNAASRRRSMSQWMSIGFDPDHMDPVTGPKTQAAISGGRDNAAPRQTGDVGQATPRELGAVSSLNDSSKH